jgi:hypothetical protein
VSSALGNISSTLGSFMPGSSESENKA